MAGLAFLQSVLESGLETDAIGLHPYTPEPSWGADGRAINPVLDSAVAILDAFGRRDVRLWITEWGVDRALAPSDSVSRAWLVAGLKALACHPRVELTTVYALTDRDRRTRFGLLDERGWRTPNGAALAAALSARSLCRENPLAPPFVTDPPASISPRGATP